MNDQAALIEALLEPRAWPHAVADIQLLQTHISWVLLTGEFAYKLKKPLTLEFPDFGTLEARRACCEEELRLNRLWAPELYLDVVAIGGSVERPEVGSGKAIEYAVKMRQFPATARMDVQLERDLVTPTDMQKLAETIATRHAKADVLAFAGHRAAVERVRSSMLDNFPPVEPHFDAKGLVAIRGWTDAALDSLECSIAQRHELGFVRDVHGDLRLANLVRLGERVVPFDCVEFSAELRTIDVISDVAFLAMDLAFCDRADLGWILMNRYLECTGDYEGMALFGLYFVYHAMIRAKVDSIRHGERDSDERRGYDVERIARYCGVALDWLMRPAPVLIAMHGRSGSGKTWLSEQLFAALPAVRVRSDIERKRLAGMAEREASDSGIGKGLYAPAARGRVYERILGVADALLESGHSVIVDAAFLGRQERQEANALAESHGVPFVIVSTSADQEELARRLRGRAGDASEADVEVLDYQSRTADELDTAELRCTIDVDTTGSVNIDDVVNRVRTSLAAT